MPLTHMSEAGGERGRAKYKEGQKVTGRILEADAAMRRITMTLKKALCGDKLPPFSSWEVRMPNLAPARVHADKQLHFPSSESQASFGTFKTLLAILSLADRGQSLQLFNTWLACLGLRRRPSPARAPTAT